MRPSAHSADASRNRTAAFTLVELLVVIAIIGTLVALLLPAVQSARETARGNTCRNNLKQLNTALINYDVTLRELPGMVNSISDRGSPKVQAGSQTVHTSGRRASWIVMLFPYLEQTPLWDQWSTNFGSDGRIDETFVPELVSLQCPSDAPDGPGTPALSYVGNAGQAFDCGTRPSTSPVNIEVQVEYAANGVFFDANRNNSNFPGAGWLNVADGREGNRLLQMSIDYIQSNDGTSKTLVLSENINAVWYTYPSTEFEPNVNNIADAKHHFGFVWHNQVSSSSPELVEVRRVNGGLRPADIRYANPSTISDSSGNELLIESTAYPSSNHPGGVNMAFADGRVQFVSDDLEDRVYAQIMTTQHKRSKYFDVDTGVTDRELPQPTESDL